MHGQSGPPTPVAERQVLVVGGSLAGLATAAFLQAGGLSPVVVTASERDDETTRDVVLWSSARSLLAELDPDGRLPASPTVVREWLLRRPGGASERLTSAHDGRWPVVTTDRARLSRQLRTRLPPGGIRMSKTPSRLDPTDAGLLVEFEDGVRERFDVVVGGEGPRSWVRESLFDDARPTHRGTARVTLRTDGQLGSPGTITELWTADGTLTLGPPGSGRAQFVTTTVDASDRTFEPAAAAVSRLSTAADRAECLPDRRPLDGLDVVDGDVDVGVPSDRWVAGRAALVGDAARPLPPTLPLGPSLAIEDAYVLAEELTRRASVTAALRRYARRRRGRQRLLGRALTADDPCPTTLHASRDLRATLLRAFFAQRPPAMSADVADHL
jgi:salicylate hydroxylase